MIPIYPLDMALDSVDDQYEGCREKMAKLVETEYLKKELKNSDILSYPWNEYENKVPVGVKLKKNHLIAIRVYTSDCVYKYFNKEVRSDKSKYKDKTFKWYSLHFLLTEAIQILKETQNQCRSIYRGTNIEFQGQKGTEFRFGSFTSFSLEPSEANRFGTKSCFEIKNYKGAELTQYSEFSNEKEVLVPPYEMFRVTDVKIRDQNYSWCETVFILEFIGTSSQLNCALFELKVTLCFSSQKSVTCNSVLMTKKSYTPWLK
uniref:NAD(P)(+)--arginine ADP-ribosyltransferase n=1 Tax=Cyprinus carpio TaxID=7962 RepID=A0A8C1V200_CYPCA